MLMRAVSPANTKQSSSDGGVALHIALGGKTRSSQLLPRGIGSVRCAIAAVCVPTALLLLFGLEGFLATRPVLSSSGLETTPRVHDADMEDTAVGVSLRQGQFRAQEIEAGLSPEGVVKFVLQELQSERVDASAVDESWRTLSFREVAQLWRKNPNFADSFAAFLAAVPFEAMFWESAPVTSPIMDKPYEYVTVRAARLESVSADSSAFDEYLAPGEGTTDVVTFRNLRGDALLVSPCRSGTAGTYAHLAKFVRGAPRDQIVKFFSAVGAGLEREVASRRDDRPVWLSTSGLGVYWLHARLDSVPKYYSYAPYKTSRER